MRRVGAWVLVLYLPVTACAQPRAELDVKPTERVELQAKDSEDRRPKAGPIRSGEDLTALVRQQNSPGHEPPLPTQKGVVLRGPKLRKPKRTKRGFVTQLGYTRDVPTPAYYKGRIYAGGFGSTSFYALNAETGENEWSLRLSDDGPTAPVCKDGVCVFNTWSCTMFGIDAETGEHLWSWWLGSPQYATPVVAGNTVYTSYPGEGGPAEARFVLAAFDLKTGKAKWRRWIDAEVNSTPVAFGGRVYVATQVGTLYEFGARDGEVVSAQRSRAASAPIVTANAILFERAGGSSDSNEMLVTAHPVFPELEAQDAAQQERVQPRPRPLLVHHRLLTVEGDHITATNSKSGARMWRHRIDGGAAGVSAPMIYAGRSILLATGSGSVLRMDPDSGEVTDTFELDAGAFASQPIVHDGWIYAGTKRGAVVAHDTGQAELTGWEMLGGGPSRQGSVLEEDS